MKQKIGVLCAVRDDSVIKLLIREMDDGERWAFYVAASGTDALQAAKRFAPDILVTDAVLPGLDGPALIDRMRVLLGNRMPRIIGGAMMPFSREAFRRRGVKHIVDVPWRKETLRIALLSVMEEIDSAIDWNKAREGYARACELLEQLGMRSSLRGFAYLGWAAALVACNESRIYAIGERVYAPIAEKYDTASPNVERLIRHAVESTMDTAKAREIYGFFGNTIDPTRGKPTNAQMIGMLAQKVRVGER